VQRSGSLRELIRENENRDPDNISTRGKYPQYSILKGRFRDDVSQNTQYRTVSRFDRKGMEIKEE
jgi:hypothetical protein